MKRSEKVGALVRDDVTYLANGDVEPSPVRWAFDTETQDGYAVLLIVAGPDGVHMMDRPRDFGECFDFLAHFTERYMAYNVDFDARAILKFLPRPLWLDLHLKENARWRGHKIYYRSGKELVCHRGSRRVAIYDVWPFFQWSLAVATKKVFGESRKLRIPQSWYSRMGAVLSDPRTRGRALAYAAQDGRATRDLWLYVDGQYRALGVGAGNLSRPLSPGSLASGYFGERLRSPRLEPWINWTARNAYAGGRIEVLKRGRFPRVWVYDMRSAYPFALSRLPDPRGTVSVWDRAIRPDAVYSVYKVRVNIPPDHPCPPITVWDPESKGGLRFYPSGRYVAWVTGPELELLFRKRMIDEVFSGVHLVGDRKPWLSDIPRLFLERDKRPEISYAIKLVLNSTYGKLAQTDNRSGEPSIIGRGTRRVGGRFTATKEHLSSTSNFFVASHVTAETRLALWKAAESVGFENVVLFATDGLMTTRPLPQSMLGNRLGDWTLKAEGEAVVVGAGVYAVRPKGEPWQSTTRGHKLEPGVTLPDLLRSDRRRLKVRNIVVQSLADAVTRGADLNAFVTVTRTLDVNFDRKRLWPSDWKRARDVLRLNQDSGPRILFEG